MRPCNLFQRAIETCVVDDDTCDPRQAIFSKKRLVACCTPAAIRTVLECSCTGCLEHASLTNTIPSKEAATRIIGDENYPSLILTFCLLVSLGCPQFVQCCLERQDLLNDASIGNKVDGFSQKDLQQNIWRGYSQSESDYFAKQFWWKRRQFFVPIFDDNAHEEYDKNDLLPFIQDQPLCAKGENGENFQEHGAFGKVFSFCIVPEYDFLSSSPGCSYVRKELFRTNESMFYAERQNLELIKRLNDPHLVKLLKSYRKGDTFNFVFQRAKTNLGFYLRLEDFGASQSRTLPIESSPLWAQALGIAKALANVINYDPPNDGRPSQPLHGYHFDLKPGNILVDYDGTLLISDFGQARFQPIGDTTRCSPIGGTEVYAPPEIDTRENRYNRKYDVWSLGCMFLEICTFVVRGHEGVKGLDHTRTTRRGNLTDDRFFSRGSGDTHTVKPEVLTWIESLLGSERLRTWHSREFLQEILELIGHMLCTNIRQRYSARDVCHTLEQILERYQGHGTDTLVDTMPQTLLTDGDMEYAPHLTRKVESMLYYNNGRWISSRLKVIEDAQHDIHILSTNSTAAVRVKIGSRSVLKVVPRYASHSRLQEGYSDCHLYFMKSKHGTPDEVIPTTRLYFKNSADYSLAHSAFIRQDIQSSLPITQCTISRQFPLIRRLARQDSGFEMDTPVTVELWCENPNLHPSVPSRSRHRHSVRQNVFSEPAPRRIVLYFEKTIAIIRFAKNVRLKHSEEGDDPRCVKIVPTEPSRDPTFIASMFKPKKGEVAASIPVSCTHLENEEEAQKFECKSIEISFEKLKDREAFFHTYQRMKKEWREEDKQLELYRKNMGQLLGYGAD